MKKVVVVVLVRVSVNFLVIKHEVWCGAFTDFGSTCTHQKWVVWFGN